MQKFPMTFGQRLSLSRPLVDNNDNSILTTQEDNGRPTSDISTKTIATIAVLEFLRDFGASNVLTFNRLFNQNKCYTMIYS